MLTSAAWIAGSFIVAALAGGALLPLLRRLQFTQHAYEDAPQSHRSKTGTPTMGGLVLALPFVVRLFLPRVSFGVDLAFLVLACAAIGFVDDYASIRRGRNRGLRARTKLLASALVAIMFLRMLASTDALFPRDVLFRSGSYVLTAPHWLWLVLGMFAVTATIHAVNLNDGLDGLAAGSVIPPLALFAAIGLPLLPAAAQFGWIGIGAALGFLIFNRHPAKMFMGDTGSLALGALLSGIAILDGEMLLLILAGGVFAIEALSVILQVGYFKLSHGKRMFLMSPIHHHFELKGWPETKVTAYFWAASLVFSAAGWAVAR
jgi:phospho-N-acetylmuramoyl-pentapeptide-transferase